MSKAQLLNKTVLEVGRMGTAKYVEQLLRVSDIPHDDLTEQVIKLSLVSYIKGYFRCLDMNCDGRELFNGSTATIREVLGDMLQLLEIEHELHS